MHRFATASIVRRMNIRGIAVRLGVALAMFAALSGTAAWGAYPERPITFVIPFAPGVADVFTRQIGGYLTDKMGQPIIVESKPGAAGNLGTAYVAKAKPDGYTLVFAANNIPVNPYIYPTPYDTFRDLTPIARLVEYSPMLLINSATPAKTLPEFIAWTKAQPKGADFGFAGLNYQILMLHLAKVSGGTLSPVAYKGSEEMLRAVLAGDLAVFPSTLPLAGPMIAAGRARGLAVVGPRRAALFPDIPTVAEIYPNYGAFSSWFGYMAPGGTPLEIVDLLSRQMIAAVNTPDIKKKQIDSGYEVLNEPREEFTRFLHSEYERSGKLVKEYNIKP